MSDGSPLDRIAENATGVVSTVVTGTWLAALFAGFDWWLGFMLFGYVVVVPLVAVAFGDEDDVAEWIDDADVGVGSDRTSDSGERDAEDTADALERLRDRYAAGDLTDEQFERKVDRLLETETPEDAADWRDRERSGTRDAERAAEPDRERSKERGRE